MPIKYEPIHNNIDMPEGTFLYSDGTYDYCIVNGESLTRYFSSEGGDYESCPIHMIAGALEVLNDRESFWMRNLLRYDSLQDKPLYKMKKQLLENITNRLKFDLFSDMY